GPPVALQDFVNPVAEVALHFENETSDPLIFISCPIPKNLICVWVHAAACLSGPDCAENCDAREKTPFRDYEPLGVFCGCLLSPIVNLPEHEEEFVPLARVGKERQSARANPAACFKGENVNAGERNGIADVGGREEEKHIRVFNEVED